jgi:uncharacterized RDD family membrane protein YckC
MSMPEQPRSTGAFCPQCGSGLPPSARFCTICGYTLTARTGGLYAAASTQAPPRPVAPQRESDPVRPAGAAVRCSAFLLDLAAMVSPALPLSVAGAAFGVAALVYVVVPVAFVAVWGFMQTWQGLTGTTFGKALLGLRLVRVPDHRRPGVAAALTRSALFAITLGLAGLPGKPDQNGQSGWHDRLTGLGVLDVTVGANPLGARPQPPLRRVTADRSLNRVHSPVPVPTKKRG